MRRGDRQSGQATVEFALIVPVIAIVFMAIAQVAVVAYTQLALAHLSREIARELAVDPSADVGPLATERSLLRLDDLRIETQMIPAESGGRAMVVVVVSHDVTAISQVFDRFLGGRRQSASTKMMIELSGFP